MSKKSKAMKVQAQVVDDSTVSGLILSFVPSDGLGRLSIEALGLPHMNRDFYFQHDGSFDGTGTFLGHEGISPEAFGIDP